MSWIIAACILTSLYDKEGCKKPKKKRFHRAPFPKKNTGVNPVKDALIFIGVIFITVIASCVWHSMR